MSGDKAKDKKGFSGLSDLASDVSGADDVSSPQPSSPSSKPSQPAPRSTAGNETERKAPGSPRPIETVGSGRRAGGTGWKWIFGIIAAIVVIWVANNGEQNSKKSSYNRPSLAARSYDSRSTQNTLAQEIENGKTRARQLETQIKDLDDRLDIYERRMRFYRDSDMTDGYNMLVPSFNSLISERNDLYEKYIRLVDEVNSEVRRYNSGYK